MRECKRNYCRITFIFILDSSLKKKHKKAAKRDKSFLLINLGITTKAERPPLVAAQPFIGLLHYEQLL